MNRREWLGAAAAAAGGLIVGAWPKMLGTQESAQAAELVIYKDPGCGCCDLWVEHARAHGFRTRVFDTRRLNEVKANLGVPRDLASCHTTLAGRYIVEGHVPADLITRLLRERPAIAGIAVPGMPIGSPGMEGEPRQRYDVIAFEQSGKRSVFARR